MRGFKRIIGEEWDFSFLLKLERYKLKRMYKYFFKHRTHADNHIVRRDLKICINLLDMVLEGKNMVGYTNFRNAKRFTQIPESWYNDPLGKEEVRLMKAWYLYNRIRFLRLFHWWT